MQTWKVHSSIWSKSDPKCNLVDLFPEGTACLPSCVLRRSDTKPRFSIQAAPFLHTTVGSHKYQCQHFREGGTAWPWAGQNGSHHHPDWFELPWNNTLPRALDELQSREGPASPKLTPWFAAVLLTPALQKMGWINWKHKPWQWKTTPASRSFASRFRWEKTCSPHKWFVNQSRRAITPSLLAYLAHPSPQSIHFPASPGDHPL